MDIPKTNDTPSETPTDASACSIPYPNCDGRYALRVGLRGRGYIRTICFDTIEEARNEKEMREKKSGTVLGFYYLVVDYTNIPSNGKDLT